MILEKNVTGFKLFTLMLVWLVFLVSAMAVVYVTFSNRQHEHELAQLSRQSEDLKEVFGQLVLEKSVWSSYARLEDYAQKRLNMIHPVLNNTTEMIE